jgi:DNA polymerase-4
VPAGSSLLWAEIKEVMALLAGYTPILEQNSIDEAWLDMTGGEGLFGKPVEAQAESWMKLRQAWALVLNRYR